MSDGSLYRDLFWLSPVLREEAERYLPAVSPAGNRWQRDMLECLAKTGYRPWVVAHIPTRLFPRGAWRVRGDPKWACDLFSFKPVSFINLPLRRKGSLRRAYSQAASEMAVEATSSHPQGLCITYNATGAEAGAARALRALHGIPWAAVLADVPESFVGPEDLGASEDADGHIFLSHYWWRESASPQALLFEGGVRIAKEDHPSTPWHRDSTIKFVYAGSLDRFAGARLLIDAFMEVEGDNVRLAVCGKGDSKPLRELTESDRRISVHGFIPSGELGRLLADATVLVNPRPPSQWQNAYNFPSKVLQYLSYRKLIISVDTPGLAPEYRDALTMVERGDADSLRAAIQEVIAGLRQGELSPRPPAIARLAEMKSWAQQGRRLGNWLNSLSVR